MPYADPAKQREHQRKWRQGRRDAWLKEHGPCAECGATEKLEVDHIDPRQKVSHNLWSWSEARRNAELAKCQVLCEDCHMAKTISQMKRADHGGPAMYQRYNCRCELCRKWKSDSDRKYRGS